MKEWAIGLSALAVALGFCVLMLIGVVWGWTHFSLWRVEYTGQREVIELDYRGQAIKAQADHEKLVRVTQADAELEAAEKTAQAIEIVGEAAREYPEYRQQEFILGFANALEAGNINQIVYVPTEANIPIMEAGKR